MITKELLRQIVYKQKEGLNVKQKTIKRDITEEISTWMKDSRVIILTGVRRCGKSTILRQLMAEATEWSFMNFEDERLLDFKAEEFEMLNEILIEAYGKTNTYFFDEIQNVDKFETFVRRLQDENKKIIITGSNAALLSKEFATRLTGRYKAFEVYPFSFIEYLSYKNMVLHKNDWYQIDKKVQLLKMFAAYMNIGGLPEYIKNEDKDYVKTVFENILYKDIIARYAIRKERTIKELVNVLTTNGASQITYNSLKKTLLLSNAITVKEYISYLNNAYLFFELLRISPSVKKQLASPRKIYVVDPAFHQVCGMNFTLNKGRNFENIVFIELKRKHNELYYFADKNECDFVIKKGTKMISAVQVCFAMDESNRKREIDGLVEAMNAYKLNEGIILTFEQTEEISIDNKQIKVVPFVQWIISQ